MSMAALERPAPAGHNNPPGPIDAGMDTACALSAWLAEHPVIETEDHARDAKLLLVRAKSSAGEIEDSRKRETAPLNEQLAEINERHKYIHNTDKKNPGILDKTVAQLAARVTDYLARLEAARIRAAQLAQKAADDAARKAAEAIANQNDVIENARNGELGVDVTQEVIKTERAIKDAQIADRVAQRAEREADNTKLAGGWHNNIGLKNKETLILNSYAKAIAAIGPHPKIEEAILSASREYRRANGVLPAGVTVKIERSI